ncbi:HlyD family secretion protein [Hwanghaeella grinnelliae]|uniref:HlyD family secretion protein n=1 Tax=Hwanghaeella grinnelliae TaxID=2500179 RepID=A0A3S2Z839_9PROT|nr:HlyD family secretion protein [Hwanghaeella grinnelliae]RVU35912.1 HlyD family secretion protein [Hwanghaeella grinnelliae]
MSDQAAQREMPTGPNRPHPQQDARPAIAPAAPAPEATATAHAEPANEGGAQAKDTKPAETRAPEAPSQGGTGETTAPKKPIRRFMRRTTRALLLLAVPICVVLAGAYWYMTSGQYISTENAYVKSEIITISPSIDGRVVDVLVSDNEHVKRGDVLFRLNARPHQIAVDQAEAKLDGARQEIARRRAEFRQVQAEIEEANERVAYFNSEFERQQALASRGVATRVSLDDAQFELMTAKQAVNTLRQKSQTVLASLGGDPLKAVELHPLYMEAEAELHQAQLKLEFTEISAPHDGIVSQMRLQSGEWVEEGDPVFGIISTEGIWVEANLKETKLTHMREGQPVEVEIDAFPGVVWPATIGSISPATGAEFAVLPPQNASGNWVKVVQRLPVRIEILEFGDRPALRAGMTATITVDTEQDKSFDTVWAQYVEKFNGWKDSLLASNALAN